MLEERLQKRFWAKVEKTDHCWLWLAKKTRGYGMIGIGRRGLKYAHRLSYEIHFGPIPSGFLVLHRCDNPACVRPEHLELGTQAKNMKDCANRARTSRGSARFNAKIDDAQAREIRVRYAAGEKQRVLAKQYGICQQGISKIVRGQKWRSA